MRRSGPRDCSGPLYMSVGEMQAGLVNQPCDLGVGQCKKTVQGPSRIRIIMV